MLLASRLNKSLEEVMGLSVLELDLWSGYIRHEQDLANKQVKRRRR
jgi:hypothetical protein